MSSENNIPKDWIETTLGETVEILSSKRIFASDYVPQGIPFYRSKEIIEKSKGESISTPLFITKKRYEDIKNSFGAPTDGDLLLSAVGERAGIPYSVENDGDFYFKDGNLIWFRNFSNNLNSNFLCYYFKSRIGQHKLDSLMIGSAQKALTIVGLKNLNIIIPSPDEQKAIANILTAFDDKIELLQAQNKTLEKIVQTIFKEWFGKYQIGNELPEGWRVGQLGKEFDITIGRTPPRKEKEWFSDTPMGKKWISIKDIGNAGTYIIETSEYLTEEAIDRFNIPIIPQNTTILSFKMTVGKLTITTEEMLSNEAIAHLKIKRNSVLSSEFIYLYLQDLDFNALGSTSSIVTAINSTMIKHLEFVLPEKNILLKFNETIKPIFKKIYNNINQIQTLKKTRDTLLPKLMSGEVRVNEFKG